MKKKPVSPPGATGLRRRPRTLLRAALIVAAYLFAFIILDFITKQFEGLPGIVAWYPPAGLTYTLLFVFGVRFAPAVTIALFISSLFIYRMPQPPYLLFLWAFIISLVYGLAAAFLRHRIRFDWQLRKLRDVVWFVFTTVAVSALLAVLSVSSSALSGDIPRSEVVRAIFDWWIGETVGVLTIAPFLLVYVMPGLKRFAEGQPVRSPALRSFPRPTLSAIGQAATLALTLYWVFGAPVLDEFHPLFLIALPLIWIAMTRGLKGISAAILALNSGVVLALWLFRFDLARLGELELLMIVNCIVGLLMGAVGTERLQSEEWLHASEERYRILVEQAPDGIFVTDSSGKFVDVNVRGCAMLGYPCEEILSKRLMDLFPPEDLAANPIKFEEVQAGIKLVIERRWICKDGSLLPVEISVHILSDGRLQGIIRDITERKQAEEERNRLFVEIQQRAAELDAIFKTLPYLVSLHGKDGQYLRVNPTILNTFGFDPTKKSREEIAQRLRARFPDGQPLTPKNMPSTRVLAGEAVHNIEYIITDVNGNEHTLLYNAIPWKVDGEVQGAVFAQEDITERKQAEEALLKNEKKEKRLLEQQIAANQLALALGESLNLEQVYHILCKNTRDLVDVWCFIISSYNEQAKMIRAEYVESDHVIDVSDFPPIPLGKRGEGTQSQVIHTGQPLYTPDHHLAVAKSKMRYTIEDDGSVHKENPSEKDQEDTTRSAVYLPMKLQGKIVGILQLQSHRLDAYSKENIDLLAGLANVAAVAIQNARLHNDVLNELAERKRTEEELIVANKELVFQNEEKEKRAAELSIMAIETARRLQHIEALSTIDQAISGSLDLRLTLSIVLEQVTSQLNVDAADVLLFDPHTQTLIYEANRGFRTDALQSTHLRLGEGNAGRAALERKIIYIPDLRGRKTDFLRSPYFLAEGFVAYYGVPLIAKGQVQGVLEIFHRAPLASEPEWVSFMEMLAGQAAIAIDSTQLFDNLQRSNSELALAYDATIEGWSHALDLRDKETEGHTQRVTEITIRLAKAMGLADADLLHIRWGALLHDIGKMGVPDSILLKPGPLTDEEWVAMKKHPIFAYEMLSPIRYLRLALDIPYCHHEKWDGTGYPRGLKREQIPLTARIFAVVDVWDALSSDRPYRKAWTEEKVREHIRSLTGTHFDPNVVPAFLRLIEQT